MAYNSVTLVGNLVEDPELRFTASGIPRANIRIAVSHRWRDPNNEWQEETSFFSGTVWRQYAENVAESLEKGLQGDCDRPPPATQLGNPGRGEAIHCRSADR